jgi:peptidoglycan/xylan/chitin deacetylase (PgdA/CDA1 family)
VPTDRKAVTLTFDDGPSPRNTPPLVDLLAKKKIRANFFLVGRHLARYESIARETVAAGHEVGNHTYHHVPLTLLPSRMIVKELRETEKLLDRIAPDRVRTVRPPLGWFSMRVLNRFRDLDLMPVLGDVYPQDPSRPGVDTIVDRVRARIRPGSIVILHDGGWRERVDRSQTIEAVDRLTDELGAEGYRFECLSELCDAADL